MQLQHARLAVVMALAAPAIGCSARATHERATADAASPDAAPLAPPLGDHGVIGLDGRPIFPIILSMPPPLDSKTPAGVDGLDEVTGAGVNMLKVGPAAGAKWTDAVLQQAQAWNAAAAARGVYTWMYLSDLSSATAGSAADALLQEVLTTLKDQPGMGLWKGADEPWWNNESAGSLQHVWEMAHAIDPVHPITVIEAPRGTATDLGPYSAVTDVHGIDIYPVAYGVPDPNLHQVGQWAHTIEAVTPDQSIIMALQICFSGSVDPSGSGAFVEATRAQERYMIYDAIINGARGLSFFGGTVQTCWNASDRQLGWNWTYWNDVLRDLVREIGPSSELYPALLTPGTGLGLRTSDSSTGVMSRQVRDPVTGQNHIWVFAAHSGAAATVTIDHLPSDVAGGTVYGEGRQISASAGAFQDSFERWGVHVYHFVQ
jgi:hypothetical protein